MKQIGQKLERRIGETLLQFPETHQPHVLHAFAVRGGDADASGLQSEFFDSVGDDLPVLVALGSAHILDANHLADSFDVAPGVSVDQRRLTVSGENDVLAHRPIILHAGGPGHKPTHAVDVGASRQDECVQPVPFHDLAGVVVPSFILSVGKLVVNGIGVPGRVADRSEVPWLVKIVAYFVPVVSHESSLFRKG